MLAINQEQVHALTLTHVGASREGAGEGEGEGLGEGEGEGEGESDGEVCPVSRDTADALAWILVAELDKTCGVVNSSTSEASTLKHVYAVVRAEILRVGSPRLVLRTLRRMAVAVDAGIRAKEIHLLVGSLMASLRCTFTSLKQAIVRFQAVAALKLTAAGAAAATLEKLPDPVISRPTQMLAALEQSDSPLIKLHRRPPGALGVSAFAVQEGAELDVISPRGGH